MLRSVLAPPEVLESGRGQLGVAHRVLDVLVPEIGLQSARVVPLVSQGEPTGVPQHVRVSLEAEPSGDTSALDHARKAGRGEGRATL